MDNSEKKARLRSAVQRRFGGISWQSGGFVRVLPVLDAVDQASRRRHGLEDIPPYSIRIRGTGVSSEFGGYKYHRTGVNLAHSLIKYAGLRPDSDVLEIGSGAGRIAYALTSVLDAGKYTGLDVDSVSISACRANEALQQAGFRFVHADIATDLYNDTQTGADAATYRLPFDDWSFDIVYLESVFTHLTDAECANYAIEMMRVLRPGGRAVVSGFLRDLGTGHSAFTFSHRLGDVWVEYPDNPRKAVAADTATFDKWFGHPHTARLRGAWRDGQGEFPNQQDWMIYEK
jgi:SAM-dependent methyltransferase